MSRIAALTAVLVCVFAGVVEAKEPSYAEQKACEHMLEFLNEADQVLGKLELETFTRKLGPDSIEARITRSNQERSRCPKDHPTLATADERIAKLRATVAAKVEEARSLAPGARKVIVAVKAWVTSFEATRSSEPMSFQDPNHKSVVKLREGLAALDAQLAKAGNPDHPDAKEAAAAIVAAKAQLEAALAEQQKAVAALGDWKAKALALSEPLDQRYVLQVPIDDAKIDGWIDLIPQSKADVVAATAFRDLVRSSVKDVSDTPEFKTFSDLIWAQTNKFDDQVTYWYGNFINDISLADSTGTDFTNTTVGTDGFPDARRKINNGWLAAKHKERFLRIYKHDDAGAAEAAEEVKKFEAKLTALDATEEKLMDSVRLPANRGTPEMQKLMKQVMASKDFASELSVVGGVVLRAVVTESAINHYNTREWYGGRWYARDYDIFNCMAAVKEKDKKVWIWWFDVRFARSDFPEFKTKVWTFTGAHRFSRMREANVNK